MAITSDPEHRIARDIRRGNHRRALEQLARAYSLQLGRLCLALVGNQAEAEELVQEILLAAYAAMPGFAGRSTVRTWLWTIARRSCSRSLEKQSRRQRLLRTLEPAPEEATDPRALVLGPEERERLRRALAELPPSGREVLLLRYVGDLSFREVAQICGIREEAARQRASSALRLLRRQLAVKDERPLEEGVVAACQEMSR